MGYIFGGNPATSAQTIASTPRQSMLYAARPAAAANTGVEIRFTDVGGGSAGSAGGTILVSNGVRWRPNGGFTLLDAIDTANVGLANTTEQQLNPNHAVIPASLFVDGDRFRVILSASKSGTSDTCTLRLRFGPTGTSADQLLTTISSLAASNQSYNDVFDFKRLSATTVQAQGAQTFKGASPAVYPNAITVANMNTNPMYLTITGQMTSGTETPTVQDYRFEWYATDV